ncbi:MAG TPA: phytoene/squalene synthase family protein, partial [bacterium]|nr:phytoene/squalene synthase family protein [bacterium]
MKLEESFEYCRNLTYQEAKNFYFSFLFLPKELRNAIYTIYAFCRIADDIADAENIELSEKKRQFKEFDELFDKCFQTAILINDKMFTALQYIINKYKLSRKFLYDIVIGVRSDLEKTHYVTFQELYDYCYKVASSVAFVCIELFVPEKHRTKELFLYGEYLGIGLQLTNILRDISEDYQKQRRYAPLEWLDKFNITDAEFCEALEKN